MSRALYRKYRSRSLSEIVGQDQITDVLSRALATNNIGHAYLLTGPRGTGKTSIARILAHEINKLPYADESDHLDIIEIDAASNNGVDDVRDLREKALIAPINAPKKIYIIDEVHMLSKQAFNALLKTLEEPPAHVVFILATTDFDKVPDTIVSRTQCFHFRLIDPEKVAKHLAFIAKEEGIKIDAPALELIAERGGGSFRDSISLLDQLQHISDKKITAELIEQSLGLASSADIKHILDTLVSLDAKKILAALQKIEQQGVSATALASQLLTAMRRNLADQPQFIHYLEGLNSVAKSSHPQITLLVTLLELAAKSSTPAAAAPQAEVYQPAQTPAPQKRQKSTTVQTAAATPTPKVSAPVPPSAPAEKAKPASTTSGNKVSIAHFEWEKVLSCAEAEKSKSMGVYSLLTKCSPHFEAGTLTLYAGNSFNKNRLDSAKSRTTLSQILLETHGEGIEVVTLAHPAPPKDEQAAKIAAMMGGGEEVHV